MANESLALGQDIDPGLLSFYKALSAKTPAGSENWPLDQQRKAWNAVCAEFRAPRPKNVEAIDLIANGVPCRVFRVRGETARPGILYGHGGGWVLGGPDTHDDICAEMAAGVNAVVVLVDYRLAPEHPHPAQLEDSMRVWRWMRERGAQHGVDPECIIAAGDSAGGQMSVALALSLRDLGLAQLKGMALIYPVLGANVETESYRQNANAPCLTRSEMQFYLNAFLGKPGSPAWLDDKAVPNLVQNAEGLPSAFITVAAHDPLHDDGVIFHKKLLAAGIASTLRHEPRLTHSYMRARHHSAVAMQGYQAIIEALKEMAV